MKYLGIMRNEIVITLSRKQKNYAIKMVIGH